MFPTSYARSWWFLWIPCPRGRWNRSHTIFVCCQDGAFHVTTFASPSVWHAFLFPPRVLVMNDLAWMWASFLSISPRTTHVRLEASLLMEYTEWNLSKNQTNLLIHRCSKSRRCGALVWHPNSFLQFWTRRDISVEQGMILLSASKVWLSVQRDGGIWSFPTWTRNRA